MRSDRGGAWLVVLALLIVAAFLVPYTWLRDTPSFVGAFAFWTAFGVAAVAVIVVILRRWQV